MSWVVREVVGGPWFTEGCDTASEIPAVNEIEWRPFEHSKRLLGHAGTNGIVIRAYGPLTCARLLDDVRVARLADRYGKAAAHLLRWNLQLDTVPLPKANNYKYQREHITVFEPAAAARWRKC